MTDAQLCRITPGKWQLRVSGPVISLNANRTLSPVVASRAVSWARRHRNIRRLFPPLDCSSSMSSTSLGNPLAQVGTRGPRQAFHQKITRAAGSVAVVATERSDAREQTCFAASHLFYCEVDGARSGGAARQDRLDDGRGSKHLDVLGPQSRWAKSGMSKCWAVNSRTVQIVILLLGADQVHACSSGRPLPRTGKCHDLPVVSIEMDLTTSDSGDLNASRNRHVIK